MLRALLTIVALAVVCCQQAAAATYRVRVGWEAVDDSDGVAQWYSLFFYPPALTIVYGDTVTWTFDSSEPHNVVIFNGTRLSETQPNGKNLTAIAGEVGNQTHFVDYGAVYSSGIRANLPPASLIFIPAAGSGTFNYYCSIHQGMDGTITVLPAGSTAPMTPAQVDAQVQTQIDGIIADAVTQTAQIIANAAPTGPQVTHNVLPGGAFEWIVVGGQMAHNDFGMQMFARFLPSYLEIQVGDTVTWVIGGMDPHWVFFNAAQTFPPIFAGFDVHGGVPLNATTSYVNDPYSLGIIWFQNGAPSTVIPHQTWPNAAGLINSGLMFAEFPGGPPFPHNISVTFTTEGTWRYSCPIHADLGMFGTVVVKPRGAALCTNARNQQTCARVPGGGVRGDPQFTGLLGQSFQVHGIDGGIYNLITDTDMQVNSQFTFISDSDVSACPNKPWKYAGLDGQKIACWSHDGSYLSAIGVMDNNNNRLSIVAGSGAAGFAQVQLNGEDLLSTMPSQNTQGQITIQMHSTHHLSVTIDEFTLHIENSDRFVNLASVMVDRARWSSLSAHGLLGQTWHRPAAAHRGSIKHIEGEVDDYLVSEDNLFGVDFVFNRFVVQA